MHATRLASLALVLLALAFAVDATTYTGYSTPSSTYDSPYYSCSGTSAPSVVYFSTSSIKCCYCSSYYSCYGCTSGYADCYSTRSTCSSATGLAVGISTLRNTPFLMSSFMPFPNRGHPRLKKGVFTRPTPLIASPNPPFTNILPPCSP